MRFDEIDLLIKIEDFVTSDFIRNHVDAFAKEDEEALRALKIVVSAWHIRIS